MYNNQSQILDIMLDVETLGNSASPVLTQLSAVCFKIEEGQPLDQFNKFIKPQSCALVGLTCASGGVDTQPTMDFWLTQPDEVFKKVILTAFTEGEDVKEILLQFTQWIKDMQKKHNCRYVRVYGNGPAADCTWVRSAYNACKIPPPWKYWDDACVRTYVDLGRRILGFDPKKDMPFEGEKHNAIDDCKHQIKYVCAIFKKLKK